MNQCQPPHSPKHNTWARVQPWAAANAGRSWREALRASLQRSGCPGQTPENQPAQGSQGACMGNWPAGWDFLCALHAKHLFPGL